MKSALTFFSLLLCIATKQLVAQTFISNPEGEPYARTCDYTHLKLDVAFNCALGQVNGTVTHYFKPLQKKVDTLFFNATKITASQILLNGKAARFVTNEKGITVFCEPALKWGTSDSISIQYTCTPRKGIYFIGWNDATNRCRKQIWTQGEGEDNRNWIPMFDGLNDKATTEMIVHFDPQFKVLSNGKLLSEKKDKSGLKIWHYKMSHPHSTYLIMLGIGDYAIENRVTKSGVPVHLYYYPDQADRVGPTYKYATECIEFLEQQTGIKYPWESYSQIPVQDFMYGAMENTTATIFGDFLQNDARGAIDNTYTGVDVHELTHQWFGDYVTGRSWKQIWLQESYATYYPKAFFKKMNGMDIYEWNRRGEHRAALSFPEKDNLPIVHPSPGTARIYQKGSAVIDMANYVWGEESWQRVIHYYLRHHAYSNVETNDLYQAFQDTLGVVPDWFFNEWLYRGGEPNYKVNYTDMNVGKDRMTQVIVEQQQQKSGEIGLFKMPIVLQVFYTDGTSDSTRVWIQEAMHVINLPNKNNQPIRFVLFDPGSYVLKKVSFEKSLTELLNQLQYAPHMIDRYDAAMALRAFPIEKKRAALIQQFSKEIFHALKSEIVFQLANDDDKASMDLLKLACTDKSSEVRQSVVNNVKVVSNELLPSFEQLLLDSSYVVVRLSLEKLSNAFPQNTDRYLEQTKVLTGVGNSLLCKWLEIKASQSSDKNTAIQQLVDLSGVSYEFQTRKNAAEALKHLNYCDTKVIQNLLEAMCSSNSRLAGPMSGVLGYFYENLAFRLAIKNYYRTQKWSDWQKEILDKSIK
jgi:aminopeptidase N